MDQITIPSRINKNTHLDYYTDSKLFRNDYDELEKFVKEVEKLIRKDARYDMYLAKLHEADVLRCSILGNAKTVSAEMHHGPIFDLFTIVKIVVADHMRSNDLITTFSIADEVLECHEENIIQVVGLSTTPHKAWHMRKIFVHINAAFGDVDKFIYKYRYAITDREIKEIERFVSLCKEFKGSIDNGLFDTAMRISFK